jgi:hypothetical protein
VRDRPQVRDQHSTVKSYLKGLGESGFLPQSGDPASAQSWPKEPCGCLRKTSKLGHGLPTGKGASFSSEYVE